MIKTSIGYDVAATKREYHRQRALYHKNEIESWNEEQGAILLEPFAVAFHSFWQTYHEKRSQ